ncbi:universal stress protein [Corynebacterium sp.]|uniref:universal stress protein n=1 Tax=Corynebacterium sp. TaxID=1720 RepID=UPI0026DF4AE9|nr:universal stress protein [Corynebacterium sp.]MDO5512180.1 universal stress protein [Corynebacterium sp.]
MASPFIAGAQAPARILVAWRPDSPGTEAIDLAAWLSRTTDVQIRVVSTLTRPWPASSFSRLGGKYRKWFKKQAEACEVAVKRALNEAGVEKHQWDEQYSLFLDGPSESVLISEAATDFDAHLIILGSDAAAPKGRYLAGSTADALLHSSPIPLGLAPRAVRLSKRGVTRMNYAFLETEIDENDPSLHYAADLADTWEVDMRILAFSPSGIADRAFHDKLDFSRELIDEWREHSLAILDRSHDVVAEQHPDLSVASDIGSGTGWAGAIDALKWRKGDLLVLASTPPGPLERVFVGSTATEFLRHVHMPVIIHPTVRN